MANEIAVVLTLVGAGFGFGLLSEQLSKDGGKILQAAKLLVVGLSYACFIVSLGFGASIMTAGVFQVATEWLVAWGAIAAALLMAFAGLGWFSGVFSSIFGGNGNKETDGYGAERYD